MQAVTTGRNRLRLRLGLRCVTDVALLPVVAHELNTLSECRTVVELKTRVTTYFDTEGALLEAAFRQHVHQKLQQYTARSKKHN